MRKTLTFLFCIAMLAGCSAESNTARLEEKQDQLQERVESLELKLHESNKQIAALTVELSKTRDQLNDLTLAVSRSRPVSPNR